MTVQIKKTTLAKLFQAGDVSSGLGGGAISKSYINWTSI
jgi:hypothetical protein